MQKEKYSIFTAMKGMGMGVAEAIPGVSGGTIAFLTGIYERLITAIRNFDAGLFGLLRKGEWKAAWQRIDGMFLFSLFSGMVVGLLLSVFAISYFLEHYPTVVWGFFFGLIASSSLWLLRDVSMRSIGSWAVLILGIAIAFGVVSAAPAEGSTHFLYVFFCGMVAICALVLPGISGSFILLLLGMYAIVINSVKEFLTTFGTDQLFLLTLFGLGCISGLLLFVRVLHWAYNRYRERVIILLCGFMIGSLWKIWPWRNPVLWMDGEGALHTEMPDFSSTTWMEDIRVISESNVLPDQYAPGEAFLLATVISFAIGAGIVWLFPSQKDQAPSGSIDYW